MTGSEAAAVGLEQRERQETMSSRSVEKRRQWSSHVEQWQSSGVSQKEYCRRKGLKLSSFYYWKKRLKQNASPMALVQVPVKLAGCSQGLVLIVGDCYKVEIGDNFQPSTLTRLVKTLGQLSCW